MKTKHDHLLYFFRDYSFFSRGPIYNYQEVQKVFQLFVKPDIKPYGIRNVYNLKCGNKVMYMLVAFMNNQIAKIKLVNSHGEEEDDVLCCMSFPNEKSNIKIIELVIDVILNLVDAGKLHAGDIILDKKIIQDVNAADNKASPIYTGPHDREIKESIIRILKDKKTGEVTNVTINLPGLH